MAAGRSDLGRDAEQAAERALVRDGYRILARRYRASGGEIDLVASRKGEISFVEVKARRVETGRDPAFEIDPAKQARIVRAARSYLARYRLTDVRARLGVALVRVEGEKMEVRLIRDAYELPPERDG